MDIFCPSLKIEIEMVKMVQPYKKYILNLQQFSESIVELKKICQLQSVN